MKRLGMVLAMTLIAGVARADADYDHLATEVYLDPIGGATSAVASLTLHGNGAPLAQVGFLLDAGITLDLATASGYTLAISQLPHPAEQPAMNLFLIDFSPPVPAGTPVTLDMSYSGTLLCLEYQTKTSNCDIGPHRMNRFFMGSAFVQPLNPNGDRMTQTMTIHVPSGMPMVAGATAKVAESDDGAWASATWTMSQPEQLTFYFLTGTMESIPLVTGPTSVTHHRDPSVGSNWGPKLADWMPRIIAFVETELGRPFLYRDLQLVELPPYAGDVGLTTTSLVSLSDFHASSGDAVFEENWVHEMGHLFFGVASQPSDALMQYFLNEGMVQQLAVDYGHYRHPEMGRDAYLGWRNREYQQILRYVTPMAHATPVKVASFADSLTFGTHGFIESFAWQYLKTTALVDYLRVVVGDEVFRSAQRAHLDACTYAPCTIEDFKTTLEAAAQRDLTTLFEQWVYAAHDPQVEVAFEQAGGSVEVRLSQQGALEIPLELWLERDDGSIEEHAVVLTGSEQSFVLTTDVSVRAVRPNPRQDAVVQTRSRVAGDVDFSGDVDGFDVVACAWRVGKKVEWQYPPNGGEAITGVDLDFDPRCDADHDGDIDEDDLAVATVAFGNR